MKREDSGVALSHLQRFLIARGWQRGRSGRRIDEYKPPTALGLPSDFTIAVPQSADPPDVPRLISTIASTLADLYSCTVDQLEPVIEKADAVLTMTISSDATADGSISLASLSGIVGDLRNLILSTTAFVWEDDPTADQVPSEAYDYLERCRFLQTTRGSFGASVRLPTQQILYSSSETNPNGVSEQAIVDRMTRVLSYVSESAIQGRAELFTEDHLRTHLDTINVKVLGNIKDLCEAIGNADVAFSVIDVAGSTTISLGTLSQEKRSNLASYVRFVRRALSARVDIDATGRVVELRSRNPEGNRNYILIDIQFEDQPAFLAATVDNEKYAVAVRAHRAGHPVHVVGRARRMKRQLKMTSVESLLEA